jgi:DNA-binding CsgD family transcriptional regulator
MLFEREAEVEELEAAVGRAMKGDGALIVVEGPAGIGKSRLLEAGRSSAERRGLETLRARGSELEQDFSYGIVRQLVERRLVEASPSEKRRLLAGAAEFASLAIGSPREEAGTASADVSFAVMHGLYWLIANLAMQRPVMLEIDDAHWADAPTLRFLLYLGARLEGLALLVLVAARPGEPDTDARLLAQITSSPGTQILRPEPLSTVAIASLVKQLMGSTPSVKFAKACYTASRGNPFLLRELASALVRDDVQPTDENAEHVLGLGPETVSRSLLVRLTRLPPASGALARAVAVLGVDVELDRAAALAGISQRAAGEAADALAAVEILAPGRPLNFVHPVVREAIYADLPQSTRESMHAAAADVLREAGAAATELAPHLLAVAPSGDESLVAALREAARAALEQGSADLAQRQLRRALAEPPASALQADVLAELGSAESLAGEEPTGAIEHLEQAVLLSTDPELRAGRVVRLARAIAATGDVPKAFDVLERELARTDCADAETMMHLEVELATMGLIHAPTALRASQRLERFIGLSGDSTGELLQLGNLAVWKWLSGSSKEAVMFAERSLRGGLLQEVEDPDSPAVHAMVWVFTHADRHEEALKILELTTACARASGSVFGITASAAGRALVAWQRGDVTRAEVEARTGIELATLAPLLRPTIFSYLALALTARGELDEAEWAAAESGCGPDLPEFFHMNPAFYARGRLRLAQGRFDEALADFRELGERNARLTVRNPTFSWRCGAVEALVKLGDGERARRLAAEHEPDARLWGTRSAIGAALHAQGLAAQPHGLERLREAVEVLATSPARLDHARALVDYGAALRRAGRRTEAREPLRLGLEAARQCGASVLVKRAHSELLTAGARPRRLMFSGLESLTASERRVVELAAGGQSNRDIAQSLFVTVKTVENHLSRAYNKLGIGSREKLEAALMNAG